MSTLTREKAHQVVASLARGRSIAMTAERCHVPPPIVLACREKYGPGLVELEAAARELAKPAASVRRDDVPRLASADLTPVQRAAITAWAPTVGLHVGRTGAVAQATVDAWDHAGRPTPTINSVLRSAQAQPPTGTHEPPAIVHDVIPPTETTMTTTAPDEPSRAEALSLERIVATFESERFVADVTDQRLVKLHERATAAVAALSEALAAHRHTAKIDAEIRELEQRLAKARGQRAKLIGHPSTAAPLGPGVAKAVRAWAAANGVDVNPTGIPIRAAVDAWRAAGSPR